MGPVYNKRRIEFCSVCCRLNFSLIVIPIIETRYVQCPPEASRSFAAIVREMVVYVVCKHSFTPVLYRFNLRIEPIVRGSVNYCIVVRK